MQIFNAALILVGLLATTATADQIFDFKICEAKYIGCIAIKDDLNICQGVLQDCVEKLPKTLATALSTAVVKDQIFDFKICEAKYLGCIAIKDDLNVCQEVLQTCVEALPKE